MSAAVIPMRNVPCADAEPSEDSTRAAASTTDLPTRRIRSPPCYWPGPISKQGMCQQCRSAGRPRLGQQNTPTWPAACSVAPTVLTSAPAPAPLRPLANRRQAQMPVGRLLVGLTDAQGHGFVVAAADDLQRERQAAGGEAVRQGERAEFQEVAETREARRDPLLIDLLERDRRCLGGRGQEGVDTFHLHVQLLLECLLRSLRLELLVGRNRCAGLGALGDAVV